MTEKELVDFGNYLLSTDRSKNMNPELVSHADLENWKDVQTDKE